MFLKVSGSSASRVCARETDYELWLLFISAFLFAKFQLPLMRALVPESDTIERAMNTFLISRNRHVLGGTIAVDDSFDDAFQKSCRFKNLACKT